MPKVIIETRIDPETQHHEYRARLDANYYLSVTPEAVISADDLQSMIETELKAGLSNTVYGDIVKEMRQLIAACSELNHIRAIDSDDFMLLLRDHIKKLENCTDNIMNLCIIE